MNRENGKHSEVNDWLAEKSSHHPLNEPKHVGSSTKRSRVARVAVLLLAILFLGRKAWIYPDSEIPNLDEWTPENTKLRPGSYIWWPCKGRNNVDMECGRIVVPTDYNNKAAGITVLGLSRFKADPALRRGSVFGNPGGPGGSGVRMVLNSGESIARLYTGPHYDVVGFDPRGIGLTKPKVTCFPSPLSKALFEANTVLRHAFNLPQHNHSQVMSPASQEYFLKQQQDFLAIKKAEGLLCEKNMGEAVRYMGTTTVAKDIDFMSRVFDGDDKPINFYGGSYGSVLGAYLVNMFPDRVGRVSIDGIVNMLSWADEPPHMWARDWLVSTEDTYRWFLWDCARAGPSGCALSLKPGETADDIGDRIDAWLEKLYDEPMTIIDNSQHPGFLTAGAVRAQFLIALQQPSLSWQQFARELAFAMYDGDGKYIYARVARPFDYAGSDLERSAVTCADTPPSHPYNPHTNPTAQDLVEELNYVLTKVSPHFGASLTVSEEDGGCHFWPYYGDEVERFTGPWNHTLAEPMLIVSNVADPVTPMKSGVILNRLLGNSSHLLIQNSPGHCSSSIASLCTRNAFLSFYVNGTLPSKETVCEPNERTFPGTTKATDLWTTEVSNKDEEVLREMKSHNNILVAMQQGYL